MPSINDFRNNMRWACETASIGYDQLQRWNVYDGGEADCSSLVIWALDAAGFDTGNATYTGNISSELCARGWTRLAPDLGTAQPGDILLNDSDHVAAVVDGYGWSARVAQASIDENGNISGGQAGDQTGTETNICAIYDYPWNCILRYTGGNSAGWKQDDKGWWYQFENGSYPANTWEYLKWSGGEDWFFFNDDGYMVTGWIKWDGSWYYCDDSDGFMLTGWHELKWGGGKNWFYFANDGRMFESMFAKIKDDWYGFDTNGCMITSNKSIVIDSKTGKIVFK